MMTAPSTTPDTTRFVRQLPNNWFRTDLILAAVVAFIAVVSLQALALAGLYEDSAINIAVAQIFSVLISALLIWYRRYPVTIAVIYTVLIIAMSGVVSAESYSTLFVGFMTLYSVGAWVSDRRRAAWVRGVLVAVHWIGSIVATMLIGVEEILTTEQQQQLPELSDGTINYALGTGVVLSVGYYACAWYFGGRSWQRAKHQWVLQRAHDDLACAQQNIASAAVQAERMHIARELHDVVAHHVTVMGVHASAARRLLAAGRDELEVVEQLEHIEASSAQAVHELQTMVYTLRDPDGSVEPLPDLSRLPELIAQANTTSHTVHFRTTGVRVELTPAVELTLYRVVQEALSNSRKHAGPDVTVNVTLDYRPHDLQLRVVDDGKNYAPYINGTGTGLQGMRERMHAINGSLEAGPASPYGWQVVATVPCPTTRQEHT